MSEPERPLDGIRVIGVEQYMSAPYCTMLLADAGAEVIKIERPGVGDPRRSIPPFAEADNGERVAGGFIAYNRNKKSMTLNLGSERGRHIFRDLVAESDVVVENLRPGSMAKLGLDYSALSAANPGLIYAGISGFGRMEGYEGPYGDRPAFDIVAEAMSGIMNLVGYDDKPPSWTIYGLADIYTGMCTAFGVMQALFMRSRSGRGQFVDSAMFDSMISLNERMVMLYSVTGQEPARGELRHLYPRGAFECIDGYLAVNVPDSLIWARLCEAIGREDLIEDPRCTDGNARASNRKFVDSVLEGWLSDKTRSEAGDILNSHGVPVGPVYTAGDVFQDPQVAARKMLIPIDDPVVGEYQFARSPVLLSSAPEPKTSPAPSLGEHTSSVLTEVLGYSEADLEHMVEEGVI
ncbi:MAG: CoA transferase [Acidimicrobiia bacterium]|nr:CoA transferase [Acidimicrobiia bacterium]